MPNAYGRTLLAVQKVRRCDQPPNLGSDTLARQVRRRVYELPRDDRRQVSTLTYFWPLAMQHGMVWIGSGMKPAIGFDQNAPRESLNFIGAYTGVMASSPHNDPPDMSPADLATASAYGERFATYVATGKPPSTPYRNFTFDERAKSDSRPSRLP